MTRYAVLTGAADLSEGMQKSLMDFKDFLTSDAGGRWQESEIMICGPLDWPIAQLLQSRLKEYDFVLVYECRFSRGAAQGYGASLRGVTESGRGVFISDVCDEVVGAEAVG
ncbi:MAG: hypothetical protein K2H73_08310, partial [Treponemataceae bacterium]|nr:hypothetical protein [Treponemataceae bacterium]